MFRHLLIAFCLSTAACGGSTAATVDPAKTRSELDFSDVRQFEVRRGTRCSVEERWTVDLVNGDLAGTGCVDRKVVVIDRRRMSGEHQELVRKALFDVKSASRPEACASDAEAVGRLDVVRETASDHYIDARAACDPALPVTGESLDALIDVLGKIATTPPS